MRRQQALFNVNFSLLVTVVALLPLLGALTCIVLSILLNFKESTWTHCRVANYLPSISSAIGGYAPQKYIWRICIALHAAPRFLFAFSYFGYYTSFHVGPRNTLYKNLARLCVFLHVLENTALVTLTYVSSTDNYAVHENMFIVFMVCSEGYMLLSCILYKWSHESNGRVMTKSEVRSYQYKKRLFVFNLAMFLTAVYTFFRHEWYCETGVYSIFALCEYLVVFSNIAFHYTAKYDFSDQQVLLAGEESGDHPKEMVLSLHPYTIDQQNMEKEKALFRVHFSSLSNVVAGLPFFATLFCVAWSVYFNFEESTATHCRVPNYLPSISAAIGGYIPQRNVWRICIALHAFPRFLIALAYFRFHMQFLVEKWRKLYSTLAGLCTLLHVVENFALVVLTYISSLDDREIHESMFVLFMVTSEVYMLLTCLLYRWGHTVGGRKMTPNEIQSYHYKLGMFVSNFIIFMMAVYMYFRHNWYCESGVYTGFAACEYLVVFTNIAFHYTARLDFHDQYLSLKGESHRTSKTA
ncbi:uncharacterized protein LOC128191245 [Crassostrea angulata]|uniref:uncharacterized protein LOC128191245 n=1 Tax=Magallana angulata TaxID=2784310 RepID=UPI0022B17E51|nr:uncharacterized protein LOC128191245 [Crassostrea angulata]